MAQVRNDQSWEFGPFVNWGTGVGSRSDFKFLSAGLELGKTLTPVVHAGIFSGQFQFAGNIMPLWQAYTPPPHDRGRHVRESSGQYLLLPLGTAAGRFTESA